MLSNTTGSENTSVGRLSMDANTTGGDNAAFGNGALGGNTTGGSNTAIGSESLIANTTASNNTAVGMRSLKSNTTGTSNTAVGKSALETLTNNDHNTAVGTNALQSGSGCGNNIAIGSSTANSITTGNNNTVVGTSAGLAIVDASSCVLFGYAVNTSGSGNSELVIGVSKTGKGDGTGFIAPPGDGNLFQGNNSSSWATTSDKRIKKNIVNNDIGLEKINQIQVRNFEYKTAEEITELPTHTAIKKEGLQLGVIAQEVEDILPDIVNTEDTGCKTVNADNMTWYLVNAVKELSAQVEELKTKLNEGE
jgi:hypothetical protein